MDAEESAKRLLRSRTSRRSAIAEELASTVHRQLARARDGPREVAVLLAGVGVDAGLERIVDAPRQATACRSRIVSFEVFELQGGGPRLLIREVTEEQD